MGGGGSVKEMYWVVGYWMGVTFILGYFFYMIMSYLLLLWLFLLFLQVKEKRGEIQIIKSVLVGKASEYLRSYLASFAWVH